MMTSIYRNFLPMSLLMAVGAGTAMAQPEQPKVRSVQFVTVKPDRIGDFLAAGREMTEAVKKGGSERSFSTWTSLSGPREYALVRYLSNWSELDTTVEPKLNSMAGQLTALQARINASVESQRRVFYALDHELSLPLAPGDAPQALAQVLRIWARPDQIDAFRALVKSDLLAAAKKSGMKTYSVAHVRAGGANQEYSIVSGLDNWAALDSVSPIVTGLGGQAAYDKFLAKLRPLVTRSEYEIYRFLPNQSYAAPKK